MQRFDNTSILSNRNLDFLFLAGGSDGRAYEVLKTYHQRSIKIGKVFLFDFSDRKQTFSAEEQKKYDEYKKFNFQIEEVSCQMSNPSAHFSVFNKKYSSIISSNSSIGVDISCFTKPYFFSILKNLVVIYKIKEACIFYTEPMSYIFSKGNYTSYQSTFGPLNVIEIPGYPGNGADDKKKKLIILLGFDGELSSYINQEIAPDETILINGFPGYLPKFKDISLISNEKLVSSDSVKLHYSSANNPFLMFNVLEKIKNESLDSNLSVAPLGTKPMALGACIFAIHNPTTRIIYPLPQKYISSTTDQIWQSWMYKVPLVPS